MNKPTALCTNSYSIIHKEYHKSKKISLYRKKLRIITQFKNNINVDTILHEHTSFKINNMKKGTLSMKPYYFHKIPYSN